MIEFQLSYFKSWKMMLWKCCTQYVSKFGKLSSGHRTWKGQFSFQSQRAMLNNVQTTAQMHSFNMPAKLCSKSFKLGFSNTWTENFQMCKLDLEKAEESQIKLPTSVGSQRKQENSREYAIDGVTKSWTQLSNFHFHMLIKQCSKFSKPGSSST